MLLGRGTQPGGNQIWEEPLSEGTSGDGIKKGQAMFNSALVPLCPYHKVENYPYQSSRFTGFLLPPFWTLLFEFMAQKSMSENLLKYMVHFSLSLALGFHSSLHFNTCQLLPQRGYQKNPPKTTTKNPPTKPPFIGLPSVSSLWPYAVSGKGMNVKVIYITKFIMSSKLLQIWL